MGRSYEIIISAHGKARCVHGGERSGKSLRGEAARGLEMHGK